MGNCKWMDLITKNDLSREALAKQEEPRIRNTWPKILFWTGSRYLMVLFLFAFLFCCEARAVTNDVVVQTPTNITWFPVGERLIYKMYWGVIPVGEAEFSSGWVDEKGKTLLVLTAQARTTSIVAKIYPVDDMIVSVIDPETFLPVRYYQRLVEGRHRRNDKVTFDHKKKKAVWESTKNDDAHDIVIGSDTRDVLSLVYYMRSKGYKVGQVEKFRVLVDDKLYDLLVTGKEYEELKVMVRGKDEKIKTLKLEPKARFGGIFVRKGKVEVWFSEDSRRLCVRMKAKVPLASVKAILKEVQGPGNDRWVKGKGKG